MRVRVSPGAPFLAQMNLNLLNEPKESDFIQFTKELSPLASCSLSSPKDKFILHKIAKQLRAGAIVVEIGTYLGNFHSFAIFQKK